MKFNETTPIYLQIKSEIEKAIISQTISEETKIDSIRELAKYYQVNPQTISNAFNDLLNDDILYKKRGIGTFVGIGAREKLLHQKTGEYLNFELKQVLIHGKNLGIDLDVVINLAEKIFQGGEK